MPRGGGDHAGDGTVVPLPFPFVTVRFDQDMFSDDATSLQSVTNAANYALVGATTGTAAVRSVLYDAQTRSVLLTFDALLPTPTPSPFRTRYRTSRAQACHRLHGALRRCVRPHAYLSFQFAGRAMTASWAWCLRRADHQHGGQRAVLAGTADARTRSRPIRGYPPARPDAGMTGAGCSTFRPAYRRTAGCCRAPPRRHAPCPWRHRSPARGVLYRRYWHLGR